MQIYNSLADYGFAEDILAIWRKEIGKGLLPVQAKAVNQFGLFKGQNLIVFSPTSSGKTFIGEMAAVRAARSSQNVFYLVPQKALAEEKYREFARRYSGLGIRVVISNRDHHEFDEKIEKREFDIAVVVYEKMQGLLVKTPSLLKTAGLIVVDELQMITDEFRGPALELLLTKIVTAGKKPQILGLSAVLGDAEKLAKWMKAKVLIENRRPVELRKGIVVNGDYKYKEHNSGAEGTEEMPAPPKEAKESHQLMLHYVAHGASQGEQCLVFLKDRASTVAMAQGLSKIVDLPEPKGAVDALNEMDETFTTEILADTLKNGIAFHNSDLLVEERILVERLFRQGKIRVLFSTSTLAMGMNLPAKNVFIYPYKWQYSTQFRKWGTEDITRSEYENMSGRAGRLSLEKDFGRSILVGETPFSAKAKANFYVNGDFETIKPMLAKTPLETHVINLVASGLSHSRRQIAKFLLGSFSGQEVWRPETSRKQFHKEVDRAVDVCIQCEMIRDHDEKLIITELGRTCAAQCLHPKTAYALYCWAKSAKLRETTSFEMLVVAARSKDAEDIYVNMSTEENRQARYRDQVLSRAKAMEIELWEVFAAIEKEFVCVYENNLKYKKALILADWIEENSIRNIEEKFNVRGGAIRRVSDNFAWLMHGMELICGIVGWGDERLAEVRRLTERITHGIKRDATGLTELPLRGVGRVNYRKLVGAGICNKGGLQSCNEEKLCEILGQKTGAKVFRIVQAAVITQVQEEKCDHKPEDPAPMLLIDHRQNRVAIKGQWIDLKPTPFKMLAFLAQRPGTRIPREEIYQHIWGKHGNDDDLVYERQISDTKYALIKSLINAIKKNEKISKKDVASMIKSKHKMGYWLDVPSDQVQVM